MKILLMLKDFFQYSPYQGLITVLVILSLSFTGCAVTKTAQDEPIPSVYSEWEQPQTISTGELKIPVFMIEFADAKYTDTCIDGTELADAVFGEDGEKTLTSFYDNASYENLHITGDIYEYTSERIISSYENEEGFEELAMEVLTAFDDEIDYTDYDANNDQILDAFVLNVPIGGDIDFWYGCQATWYQNENFTVDGTYPMYYIMCDAQPERNDMAYFIAVLTHELGHCMGLPDFYNYYSDDMEAMHGIAGTEIMDEMDGDFSQFSKLELGWLKESQVQVYRYGKKEHFVLPKATDGGCILIYPSGDVSQDGFSREQKEYFLIEYDTAEKNFSDVLDEDTAGVRILHIRSDITTDEWGSYYTYNGYSEAYDKSEDGIRIIRLVNDGEPYYQTGDIVSDDTENFEWYENGERRKPGLLIQIGKITKAGIEIDITRVK